jgi:hypothetical protein
MTYRSLLSLDIGSQHTRAWLYDNTSGNYQLVGSGEAQSTIAGGENLLSGVWRACERLQDGTGRRLLDHNGRLIVGQESPDKGVEKVGLSLSAGPRIKTALIGLTDKSSLTGIRKLASLFYTEETALLSLSDGLDATHQLESLMQADADLIILAGGDNQGASKPLVAAVENIRLVYSHLPRLYKPQIVYAGNHALLEGITKLLDAGDDLHLAPNIHPEFGMEDLIGAWGAMLDAFERIRLQQLSGLQELKTMLGVRIIPTAFAMGRMVRYLDQISKVDKGVMALDVGAGSTMLVASKSSKFTTMLTRTLIGVDVGEKTCYWSSFPLDVESVTEYMLNKSLHPAFMASTLEDLAIEHAWTRVRLQDAFAKTADLYKDFGYDPDEGLNDVYEPIILNGESLTNVPTIGQQFLMVLDGLKPHGITTLVLDKEQILASLGSLAEIEPVLPVQILDNGVFKNLGTVICAESPAKEGQKIMSIEIAREEEEREIHEIKKGSIKRYDVKPGTKARIYLAPELETDVGMGHEGLGGWVSVSGSEIGVVIDARGRPLNMHGSTEARSEIIRNWLWELGG